MMKLTLGIFSLLFLLGVNGRAEFDKGAGAQALLTRADNTSPLEGLGTVVNRTKNMMVAVYDFAVQGGTSGTTYYLLDDAGNAAFLPYGAHVTNVVSVTTTALASSGAGAGAVSLGLLSAVDLMAAKNSAVFTLAAKTAGVPVGTAATWVGPVTSVSGTQISATVTLGAVTAGKVKYFIEYVIQ